MTNVGGEDAVAIADRDQTGICLLLVCPSVVVLATLGFANAPAWLRHGGTGAVAAAAYATAMMVALTWGCARAWRMQLRFDEGGVLVRNFWCTHKIGWPEVDHFEDGSRWAGADGPVWALRVVRRDGRAVTSSMASLGGWRAARRRKMLLEAVREAAVRHGVRNNTGSPSRLRPR